VGFLKQLLSFSLHNSTGRRHVVEWNEKGKLVFPGKWGIFKSYWQKRGFYGYNQNA